MPVDLVSLVFGATLCTALPLGYDMLRTFLPPEMRAGRLVAVWHRQALISLVSALCVVAYHLFWRSVLPYSHPPASPAGVAHVLLATWLWINTVYNFAMCAAVDPGDATALAQQQQQQQREEFEPEAGTAPIGRGGGGVGGGRWPVGSHHCNVCQARVLSFDHHCPFTGGCVGLHNYRFFLLFSWHGTLGMAYATWLSWWPFRDCVLRQLSLPSLGWAPVPPPDEGACVALGGRSLLLLPAAMLCGALGCLALLHSLLLANGVTTLELARRWRTRGPAYVLELLQLKGDGETDKWAMLLGGGGGGGVGGVGGVASCGSSSGGGGGGGLRRPAVSGARRARVLLLPSLPDDPSWRLSPGLASVRHWAGALLSLAAVLGVLMLAVQALSSLVRVRSRAAAASTGTTGPAVG